MIGDAKPEDEELIRSFGAHHVLVGNHLHEGARLAQLAALAAEGVLTARIAEVLPAERVAQAHRRLEADGVRGRLVLTF